MSRLRQFHAQLRLFSTSQRYLRPALSAMYKSKDLWEERFECELLAGDQNLIKTINTKILSDDELSNLEVDVFINIAAPRKKDLAQLQEAVKTLKRFRKSIYAHTILPSTSHATCRLFLDSEKLPSLVRLLEKRIEYGVFPDPVMLNILFDEALEHDNLSIASRLASLIMLQEEFGLHPLNDNFALYSVAKYIESQTDFSDWTKAINAHDPILNQDSEPPPESQSEETKEEDSSEPAAADEVEEEGEEDEDEDDAEYIRVPFLRNPYHDNHFDLENPRQICGKTLSMLGHHLLTDEPALGFKCISLGDILLGKWTSASDALQSCLQSNSKVDENFIKVAKFYLENLHGLDGPDEKSKQSLGAKLDKLPLGGRSLSDEADSRHEQLKDLQNEDVKQFKQNLKEWSVLRFATRSARDELEAKKKLIEEIKAKKMELRHREQYLFFYDNLKSKNLARISYE